MRKVCSVCVCVCAYLIVSRGGWVERGTEGGE